MEGDNGDRRGDIVLCPSSQCGQSGQAGSVTAMTVSRSLLSFSFFPLQLSLAFSNFLFYRRRRLL